MQLEIKLPVTTAQVLHVARKLQGRNWATTDIAKFLAVKERQVRASVFWLNTQRLICPSGKEYRPLPEKYRGRTYDVQTYTVTDAGMAHEFVTTPRDVEIERFGDVAALEMALGLWGRKPERT